MTGRPSGTRGTRTRDSGRWSRSRTSRTPDLVTDGPVLRPDDAGYDEEVATFNLATAHRPEVVVGATGTADVVAAVCWARQAGLPVAVQATGHGANSPVDHGVMVNTRRMTGVRIDPAARTATIGAGAKWKAVIDAATPHGLAPLSGSSSDVGVVGYTVGGGLPVLGRAFGYAADMVRSFEVVTGDGQVQQVDAEHEPELFWALRGGKGNVGIVTSLVCGLVPLGRFYGGGVFFPGSAAPRLLDSYRQWTATLADTTCTALALLRLPPLPDIPEPLRGQFVVHLRFVHLGDRSEGEALLAPMRAVAPAIIDAVDEMGYADIDHVHQDPDHPVPAKENNTLLRELTPEAVDALLEVVGPDASSPLTIVELRHMGGALARPATVPDAISARDAAFCCLVIGMMAPPVAGLVPAAIDDVIGALAPWSTGRSMVNLHGTPGDDADRARAWTDGDLARLRRDKARYDPDNLFRFGHSVRPSSA